MPKEIMQRPLQKNRSSSKSKLFLRYSENRTSFEHVRYVCLVCRLFRMHPREFLGLPAVAAKVWLVCLRRSFGGSENSERLGKHWPGATTCCVMSAGSARMFQQTSGNFRAIGRQTFFTAFGCVFRVAGVWRVPPRIPSNMLRHLGPPEQSCFPNAQMITFFAEIHIPWLCCTPCPVAGRGESCNLRQGQGVLDGRAGGRAGRRQRRGGHHA